MKHTIFQGLVDCARIVWETTLELVEKACSCFDRVGFTGPWGASNVLLDVCEDCMDDHVA